MNDIDKINIATPCKANWSEMDGGERVRFCTHCQRNVYNISTMSRSEANELVTRIEGAPCVRFYRRFDGTVLTNDCPRGLDAVRQKAALAFASAAAVIAGLLIGGPKSSAAGTTAHRSAIASAWRRLCEAVSPPSPPPLMGAPMAPISPPPPKLLPKTGHPRSHRHHHHTASESEGVGPGQERIELREEAVS